MIKKLLMLLLVLPLSGCLVTTAVGLAVDVVETAVEVPIKIGAAVGGAAIDAVSSDEDEKAKKLQARKDADAKTAESKDKPSAAKE